MAPTPAADPPAAKTSSETKRRNSSAAQFAKLQAYKREANPDVYDKRKETMDEMRAGPKGVLGGLWDR
ncbi:hypothetical protein LTR53_013453 [Teratosphaeriaceae sp. CCFEE 6253]|nr:hypothetical protein LTR53_013453 [Teratosphaeriaceae sp. CCFEE 6253]